MKTIHIALVTFCACLAIALPTSALAEDGAMKFLKARHGAVQKVLKQKAGKTRNAQLNRELGGLLDFEELSKRALKRHWDTLSAEQRAEFVSLLTQLVERNYQKNLESTMDFHITYKAEQAGGEGVTVYTVARDRKNRRAPEVSIDYNMTVRGKDWRVFDVVTDGVSLVSTYRGQFNRIIKKDGWDALLDKMRKKLSDTNSAL